MSLVEKIHQRHIIGSTAGLQWRRQPKICEGPKKFSLLCEQ